MYNVWCFVHYFVAESVFLLFTLFCREICSSRFTRFCVEKNLTKKVVPVEKNDKYDVWGEPVKKTPCN